MRINLLLNGTDAAEKEYPRILIQDSENRFVEEGVSIEEAAIWMKILGELHAERTRSILAAIER